MTKKIFLFIAFVVTLASCSSKKAAFNYNQDLVAKENSMIPVITPAETSITRFYSEGNFDSVYAIGDRLEKYVQSKIDEVDAMKLPKAAEAENFKAAYLKAFRALKSIYTNYKGIGSAKSDEERQTFLEELKKLVDAKNDEIKNMKSVQQKYASANGFRLE